MKKVTKKIPVKKALDTRLPQYKVYKYKWTPRTKKENDKLAAEQVELKKALLRGLLLFLKGYKIGAPYDTTITSEHISALHEAIKKIS